MAQAHDNRNDETMGIPATRLMHAETEAYIESQKRADQNRDISQYMFWGATTILGAVILGSLEIAGASLPAAIFGLPALPVLLAVSGVTFLGSLFFSSRGTEIGERANVLYSDIDSQNQSHRMVQAFAKAQTQGQVHADNSAPMTSAAPSWAERAGASRQQHSNWQERVSAEAAREEAQSLQAVQQIGR